MNEAPTNLPADSSLDEIARRMRIRVQIRDWLERYHNRLFSMPEMADRDYVLVTRCAPDEVYSFRDKQELRKFLAALPEEERDVAVYKYRRAGEAILML